MIKGDFIFTKRDSALQFDCIFLVYFHCIFVVVVFVYFQLFGTVTYFAKTSISSDVLVPSP